MMDNEFGLPTIQVWTGIPKNTQSRYYSIIRVVLAPGNQIPIKYIVENALPTYIIPMTKTKFLKSDLRVSFHHHILAWLSLHHPDR